MGAVAGRGRGRGRGFQPHNACLSAKCLGSLCRSTQKACESERIGCQIRRPSGVGNRTTNPFEIATRMRQGLDGIKLKPTPNQTVQEPKTKINKEPTASVRRGDVDGVRPSTYQ